MNTADLARLELAKRAYKATQAGEAEVQTGVRRARLALTRPKRRRSWFSKGLVFVVLAVGSMAYAKPNTLGEIVEMVLPREDGAGKRGAGGRLVALAAPIEEAAKLGHATSRLKALGSATLKRGGADDSAPVTSQDVEAVAANTSATAKKASKAALVSTSTARTNAALAATLVDGSSGSPSASRSSSSSGSSSSGASALEAKATKPTSDWGRVGQALADGNQSEALAALGELSASGDERTRDKADLGRAQLLMSQGETTAACALARSLTHRRAGSRIERQAQLLLKSCR